MLRRKRSRYPTSEKLFAAASRILPGGVDSPVRAFKSVGATPLFIESARGAHIEDADIASLLREPEGDSTTNPPLRR